MKMRVDGVITPLYSMLAAVVVVVVVVVEVVHVCIGGWMASG